MSSFLRWDSPVTTLEDWMKNINIQGSTLIEIIITLVIIMFVVMGLFTQQLKAIWVFNVSLEKEVMSSMLQNGF
jgi:Tfp pilus assembly protein PilV